MNASDYLKRSALYRMWPARSTFRLATLVILSVGLSARRAPRTIPQRSSVSASGTRRKAGRSVTSAEDFRWWWAGSKKPCRRQISFELHSQLTLPN